MTTVPTFVGQAWLPGDEGFEQAAIGRQFNRRLPSRRPTAVVEVASDLDVITAVNWARAEGWQVAMRSGGHAWAAWAVRDGALLIDTHRMQEMELDQERRIIKARPAVKGGETLNPYLAQFGLMFHGGHCPTVAIGGYLLQGGQGWDCRGHGWSVEDVLGLDVVTATGELVHCDANQNSDLYWAARGAGPGFFGVVTNFYLQVHDLPRHWVRNVYVYPAALAEEVMTWAYDTFTDIDSRVEIVLLGQYLPPEMTGGVDVGPVILVSGVSITDDAGEGARWLEPFDTCPVLDQAIAVMRNQPTDLPRELEMQYLQNPEGHRYCVDNAWLEGDHRDFIPTFARVLSSIPNRKTFALWYHQAPLPTLSDMAFSLQSEIYFSAYTVWEDEADDERMQAWTANAVRTMEPWTKGQYLGDSDLSKREVKFMADENFAKLKEIQRKWDPENLFVGYLAGPNGATNRNHWES